LTRSRHHCIAATTCAASFDRLVDAQQRDVFAVR
jgi:hypothetical protein